jgi:hypothetical protein
MSCDPVHYIKKGLYISIVFIPRNLTPLAHLILTLYHRISAVVGPVLIWKILLARQVSLIEDLLTGDHSLGGC